MRMGTPRSEQGQIVEYSYGWLDGALYRRRFDRSDRTETWHRADEDSAAELAMQDYDADGAAFPPDVDKWTECERPGDV